MACEICEDTRRVNVLNVWAVQRAHKNGTSVHDAVGDALNNFIVLENACPKCCGEDAFNQAMTDLREKMGGDAWDPKTYEGTVGNA